MEVKVGATFCPQCGINFAENSKDGTSESQPGRNFHTTERKHVSILFADLCDSFSLLDSDPETARALLEAVLAAMSNSVREYGGTVSQAMGDGIMAIFGAPLAYEDHAQRACLAAVSMHNNIAALSSNNSMTATIRVGICTGEAVVGERQHDYGYVYTAFGRTPHLASRLEQMASPGKTLITDTTFKLVHSNVSTIPLGFRQVRGLPNPISVFEISTIERSKGSSSRAGVRVPFVKRESELLVLEQALEDVSTGLGRIVAVVGDPGIGKSRLVDFFVSTRAVDESVVFRTAGVSYLKPSPFSAVVELILDWLQIGEAQNTESIPERLTKKLLTLTETSPKNLAAISSLFGTVQDQTQVNLPSDQRHQRIGQELIEIFFAKRTIKPPIILIDDLQWVDDDSMKVFSFIARYIERTPILLLVNHRSGFQHGWNDFSGYIQISLRSLRTEEAQDFLDRVLGLNTELDELRQKLLRRTGGNPFFIEEMVRGLVTSRNLVGTLGHYHLTKELGDLEVPATVQDVIAMRIDLLAYAEKRFLQHAAVVGYRFRREIFIELMQLTEEDFASRIHSLETAGFLHEEITGSYIFLVFNHSLTHEVAYNTLLHTERRDIHRQARDEIEKLFPDKLEEYYDLLAFHSEKAQDWQKAFDYSHKFGLKALSMSACQEAVYSFEKCLEMLGHLPDSNDAARDGMDIRFELRNALMPLGRHGEILPYLLEAESLARHYRDGERIARARSQLAHYYWLTGNWKRSIEVGETAIRTAEELENFGLGVTTRFILGLANYSVGNFTKATQYLEINRNFLIGDRSKQRFGMFALPSVVSRGWLSWCHAELGRFDQAKPPAHEAKEIAASIGGPFDKIQGDLALGGVLLIHGDMREASFLLEDAFALCEDAEIHILLPRVASALGYAYALDGQIDKALDLAERALAMADKMRLASMRSLCLRWICEVRLLAGRAHDVLNVAEGMLYDCQRSGERAHVAWAYYLKGASLADSSNVQHSLESFENAEKIATALGMRPLVAHILRRRSSLLFASGSIERGDEILTSTISLYEEMGMEYWIRSAKDHR